MAYDKEDIIRQALEVIVREQCVTVAEVAIYLPISLRTFYNWELQDLQAIKDAVEGEKLKVKAKLRRNWRNSDNPTLQIAEFKLASTDAELERLAMSKVKQETTMTLKPSVSIALHGTSDDNGQGDEVV
jgi:hypothetical protein